MPRPPLAALRGRFGCRSLWSLRQVLLSPLLSVSNPSLLSPLERGGERWGIMRRFRPAPYPLRKGAAFMPPSSGLQFGLSSPLAGWHESCSFPFATLDAPGPRTPSGVHPPNLFSEVETAKRKQPTKTEAAYSLRRATYGPFSASVGLRFMCAVCSGCSLGTWGSVTRRATGKARGKLQPH